MNFELEESDRQMLLLSLALCARLRPGWDYAAGEIAKKLGGEQMFTDFKKYNDNVEPQRSRLDPPQRWRFPWVANGVTNHVTIEAHSKEMAVLRLGAYHGELFKAGIPSEFELDLSKAELL